MKPGFDVTFCALDLDWPNSQFKVTYLQNAIGQVVDLQSVVFTSKLAYGALRLDAPFPVLGLAKVRSRSA